MEKLSTKNRKRQANLLTEKVLEKNRDNRQFKQVLKHSSPITREENGNQLKRQQLIQTVKKLTATLMRGVHSIYRSTQAKVNSPLLTLKIAQ